MDFLRQLNLVQPEALETPVVVVGCGGIGSFAALALAKMGCRTLTLYDDDKVEEHNLPNQLYRTTDVGRPKAEALVEILRAFTDATPRPVLTRVDGQRLAGIVVAGVDSMRARRTIWQRSVRYRAAVPLFLDGRLGAEVIRLYAIRPADPDDVRFYGTTLYDDAEAEPLGCSAGAIVYTGFAVGSLIANQVKRFAMGEPVRRETLWDLKTLTLVAGEAGSERHAKFGSTVP